MKVKKQNANFFKWSNSVSAQTFQKVSTSESKNSRHFLQKIYNTKKRQLVVCWRPGVTKLQSTLNLGEVYQQVVKVALFRSRKTTQKMFYIIGFMNFASLTKSSKNRLRRYWPWGTQPKNWTGSYKSLILFSKLGWRGPFEYPGISQRNLVTYFLNDTNLKVSEL